MAARSAASPRRARRWDVLVLGSALPGLAAAVRLAMGGLRVLVAEEQAASRIPDVMREPFFLPAGPALEGCLRAFGLPPIERRGLQTDEIAYQVLFPDARLDVGVPAITTDELEAWGFVASATEAEELTAELAAAAHLEAEALLRANFVRAGAQRPTPAAVSGPRGLPRSLARAEGRLGDFVSAQLLGLAEDVPGRPSSEARARLLGSALGGGASFRKAGVSLRGLLRRRLEALHGELRSLSGPFAITELGDAPGIARTGHGDAWLGRALVLNAPSARLAAALRGWKSDAPSYLSKRAARRRRLSLLLRVKESEVPEPLARRALLIPREAETGPIRLSRHPSERKGEVELVLSAVLPDDAKREKEQAAQLVQALGDLLPVLRGRLRPAQPLPRPLWDDEALRVDSGSHGWPDSVDLRLGGRRPIFRLPREQMASLGAEGELLLGWRAGDAIREELS